MFEFEWLLPENDLGGYKQNPILRVRQTHKVVENILERDERGHGIVINGYVLAIIHNPEWKVVPTTYNDEEYHRARGVPNG